MCFKRASLRAFPISTRERMAVDAGTKIAGKCLRCRSLIRRARTSGGWSGEAQVVGGECLARVRDPDRCAMCACLAGIEYPLEFSLGSVELPSHFNLVSLATIFPSILFSVRENITVDLPMLLCQESRCSSSAPPRGSEFGPHQRVCRMPDWLDHVELED